jgi:hypothetical protein
VPLWLKKHKRPFIAEEALHDEKKLLLLINFVQGLGFEV